MAGEFVWTAEDTAQKERLQELVTKHFGQDSGTISGPIGIRSASTCLMEKDREAAEEFAPLLPWVLTRGLNRHIFDLENCVAAAIFCNSRAVHDALLPHLPSLFQRFVESDETADLFIFPAYAIAQCQNAELQEAAKPFFPEALKRITWAPQNFGNLACAWLDIGGDPKALLEPLQVILNSQQGDPDGSFCPQIKEVKLGKHLCNAGFIDFLNHKKTQSCRPLRQKLYPFAGCMVERKVSVLTSIQNNEPRIFWARDLGYAYCVSSGNLSPLVYDFTNGVSSADIVNADSDLFRQMRQVPRKDIRRPAEQAVTQVALGIK